MMKEKGITLISLIITIIILIILAAVSIRIVYQNIMINIAVNGAKEYSNVAVKEKEQFEDLSNFIDIAKNRRPVLTVDIKDMEERSLTIEAKAIDQDGGNLTYKLYFGQDKDNLEEKEEKKAEQETAVKWNLTGLTQGATYYYKVEVKDQYETVDSGIKEVVVKKNKVPVITKVEIASRQTNKLAIKAQATDEDGDRLTYRLYIGTDASNLSEKAVSGETAQGIEIILTTNEYDIYTTYYYKIGVTDGKVTISSEIKELEIIGAYVAYSPKAGTYSTVTNNSTYAGGANNTVDFTTEDFNWRIWSIDKENNEIVLIADGITTTGGYNNEGTLYLINAQGYNNAVKILDEICKTCYSNNELGAVGRSLDIDDIENVLDKTAWKPEDFYYTLNNVKYHTYAESEYFEYTANRYYPYVWSLEEYSWIDSIRKLKGQGITRSTQDILYNGTEGVATSGKLEATTNIKPIQTYWFKNDFITNNFINNKYFNLLFKKENTTNFPYYWIASRYVFVADTGHVSFGVQRVGNGSSINGRGIIGSNSSFSYNECNAVRPIVYIPLETVILGEIGDGTIDSQISIKVR